MDKTSYGGRLIESKMCEARMEYPAPKTESEKKTPNSSPPPGSRYVVFKPNTETYAQSVEALQKDLEARPTAHPTFTLPDGKVVYRPLTFKETIKARVENYGSFRNQDGSKRTLKERLHLDEEKPWLPGYSLNNTCTAIIYQPGTTRFKIVPVSSHLIGLHPDFKEESLEIDYKTVEGIELDRRDCNYDNPLLDKYAVRNHLGWLAAVEGDKNLLRTYVDLIFRRNDPPKLGVMGFYHDENPVSKDRLHQLLVSHVISSSQAVVERLNVGCLFFQVAEK